MSDLEGSTNLVTDIKAILEHARVSAARSVNSELVKANWQIGRWIVEEEQKGRSREGYGEALLLELSKALQKDLGEGFTLRSIKFMKLFYTNYPDLLANRSALHNELARVDQTEWKPGNFHPGLCTDKNDTMVKYILDKSKSTIFASRYQLHLPSEDLLRQELLRELREVGSEYNDEELPHE